MNNKYIKIGVVIGAVAFALFVSAKMNKQESTPEIPRVQLEPYASPTYAANATDIEECEKNGGDWGVWGLQAREFCQYKASDAGKECTDGSQCSLGKCISESNALPGTCQKYEQTFGCFSYIENGKIASAICID